MPKCVYKDCKSTSKSRKSKRLRYYPFPKPKTNLIKCLLWLELCGNDKLQLATISKNTYVCENHFGHEKTDPIPFYEATGESPTKFRSAEVGRIIKMGTRSSNVDEYDKIISSLENQEDGEDSNGDHTYSKPSNASESQQKETQTCSRNLFGGNTDVVEDTCANVFFFRALSTSRHFHYFTGVT